MIKIKITDVLKTRTFLNEPQHSPSEAFQIASRTASPSKNVFAVCDRTTKFGETTAILEDIECR